MPVIVVIETPQCRDLNEMKGSDDLALEFEKGADSLHAIPWRLPRTTTFPAVHQPHFPFRFLSTVVSSSPRSPGNSGTVCSIVLNTTRIWRRTPDGFQGYRPMEPGSENRTGTPQTKSSSSVRFRRLVTSSLYTNGSCCMPMLITVDT